MAGLAAAFQIQVGAPPIAALDAALAVRGPAGARWSGGPVELLVRAVIPMVHEHRSAALVLDGAARVSALAARHADLGPAGLLAGEAGSMRVEPYAAILADPDRGELLLARHGDGPQLYYARAPGALLVASEPGALLAAGVPATPDHAAVDRFLAAGACDDTAGTLYAGIRQVPPNQVVRVDREGVRPVFTGTAADPAAAKVALDLAVTAERTAVRLIPGATGAALLGAAMAHHDAVAAYSIGFPEISGDYPAALLGPLTPGSVRHRATPGRIDLDGYLADLGEPTPDPSACLLWALARDLAGEVGSLVDVGPAGSAPGAARLADRVESRYGVALHFPLPAGAPREELVEIVERVLPPAAARVALAEPEPPAEPPLRALLLPLRDELLTAFLAPRCRPGDRRALLDAVDRLVAGRRVDAAALFRRYAVEGWLRRLEPVRRGAGRPAPRGVGPWVRLPVRTGVIGPGDQVAQTAARHVAQVLRADRRAAAAASRESWFVLLAAKPVAVAQGRARPVWEIRTGRYARALSRLAGGATGLDTPWAAQVATEAGGALRLAAAAGCAVAGQTGWYERLAGPRALGVRGPRADAVAPAGMAVVAAPEAAADVAAEIAGALRATLPAGQADRLSGVAVVDAAAGRVLGWAGRPLKAPADLLAELCADDPFGDGGTPVVVALSRVAV